MHSLVFLCFKEIYAEILLHNMICIFNANWIEPFRLYFLGFKEHLQSIFL